MYIVINISYLTYLYNQRTAPLNEMKLCRNFRKISQTSKDSFATQIQSTFRQNVYTAVVSREKGDSRSQRNSSNSSKLNTPFQVQSKQGLGSGAASSTEAMGKYEAEFKKSPPKHSAQSKMLSKWAHGRQSTSLQAKKAEAEVERHKKAATLRKYAKLCKAEGIESTRVNVSTKVFAPDVSGSNAVEGVSLQEKRDAQRREKQKQGQGNSSKPFRKEIRQHEESQKLKRLEQARREVNEKAIQDKKRARDEARKLHLKRTRKGQPLMGTRVKSLLSKIEKGIAQ